MITFTIIAETPSKLNPDGILQVVCEREKQTIGERLDLATVLMVELEIEIKKLSQILHLNEKDIIDYLHYEGIKKLSKSEFMSSSDKNIMEMMKK